MALVVVTTKKFQKFQKCLSVFQKMSCDSKLDPPDLFQQEYLGLLYEND